MMEQNCSNSSLNLEQKVEEIFLKIKTVTSSGNFEISHHSEVVKDVYGIVSLAGAPHYSLVLETGPTDKPFTLPLTLADSPKHMSQLISAVGERVRIRKLLLVCEQICVFKPYQKIRLANIILGGEDIICLKNTTSLNTFSQGHLSTHGVGNDAATQASNASRSTCRIMVHHISMPFYVDLPNAICLAFISFTDSRYVEAKVWLILRGKQVAWREFLIPNREYVVEFPFGVNKNNFEKSQKPLDEIFTNPPKDLQVIFHHKAIFSTFKACELPSGSKLFLASNTQFSNFVYRFTKDSLSSWFSATEADHANVDLVTFFGQVDSVTYSKELVFKSCYLCIRANPKDPILKEPKFSEDYHWMNPWTSQCNIKNNELLELPSVGSDCGTMKTGVPGSLVQVIKLRDVVSGYEQCVYMKHSFISRSQQMFRLAPGMVICISHLNRRFSSSGKYYFITTALSNFKVLSYEGKDCQSEGWGLYGLQHLTCGSQDKMWGVMELVNLSKVAITAKCSNCKAVFSCGTCSLQCCAPQNYTTNAYAIGWVQIISKDNISMEKLLIKDRCVQKLLCVPDDMWKKFLEAAAQEEITCLINEFKNDENRIPLDISELLKIYCTTSNPNRKCYVSVRRMSSLQDKEPLYYCINLEAINEYRLNIVAGIVRKAMNK